MQLSRTVTARFTIADPEAGLPGRPQVIDYPARLLECDEQVIPTIDPDAPGDVNTWVEPHHPLIFRFSERMGTIALSGQVVKGRSVGSVGGMDFRSFRGMEEKAGGREHKAIVRNMFFPLEVGAVYKLQILGWDASDRRLPATKDLSGNELTSTFTRCFRTSHVSIVYPFARPYGEIDLRKDIFIQSGIMGFRVTEKVKYISASRGVRFSTLVRGIDFSTDSHTAQASDVELWPDGSGLLCVEAREDNGQLLGQDCLRVYEEGRNLAWAVVGREGGAIEVGMFEVEFGEADRRVTLVDGREVVLPSTLKEAVEIELRRRPYWPDRRFSLRDTYDVRLPRNVELDTAARIVWRFDPDEPGLSAPAAELVLGRIDERGRFVAYSRQLLLPWEKSALVYSFSETKADTGKDQPNCNEGFSERTVCCRGQQLRQCERERCVQCCMCGIGSFGYSDMALCYCPGDLLACGKGCSIASVETGRQCRFDPARAECTDDQIEEATRQKCVKCEFTGCYDVSKAVYNKKETGRRTKGSTDCTCRQSSCWQEAPGRFCCEYVVRPVTKCEVAIASWRNPPRGCEDDWQEQKEAIENHEYGHVRRATENCEWFAEALSRPVCAGTEAEARDKLNTMLELTKKIIFDDG